MADYRAPGVYVEEVPSARQTHCWGQHQYRRVHRGGGVLRGCVWGLLPAGRTLQQSILRSLLGLRKMQC